MALTGVSLYSAITLGTGATPQSHLSAVQLFPQVSSSIAGNALVFNFIMTTGATTSGPNPVIKFRYAFSMSSYTASNAPLIVGNANIFNLRVQNTVNTTTDITTQFATPILGNYLYYWLDIMEFWYPITFSATAIPIAITNQIYKI